MKYIHFFLLFNLLSLLLLHVVASRETYYDGRRLVRIFIQTPEQLQGVQDLNLDVWSGSSSCIIGNYNDVLATDEDISSLWELDIPTDILIFELAYYIEREEEEKLGFESFSFGDDWFNSYHSSEEIVGFTGIVQADNPDKVTYEEIGTTYEGRPIVAVSVTSSSLTPKQRICIIGGFQAREWVAPATALYILKTLVESNSLEVEQLLDQYIITFIPLANPDGYEYSRNFDRLWKKNRVPNSDGSYGVDLNRNFDDHWGYNCDTNPSSATYCGPNALSEPETRAIRDYIINNGPFYATIDVGSYGQSIVLPFGWTPSVPQKQPVLRSVAEAWKNAIASANGAQHSVQNAYTVFNSGGSFRDWAFSRADVPFSYTLQLRDSGTYGFILPVSQALKTRIESYKGILSLLTSISTFSY